MKRVVYIFLFIVSITHAQNLVPNPSFEIYNSCDSLYHGIPDHNFPPWDSPSLGSMDGFNSCYTTNIGFGVPTNGLGFQIPHSGNGYIGGVYYNTINNWEYAQVELDSILLAGQEYCASFYVSFANNNNFANNNIGMYFSDAHTYVPSGSYLNFTPQINDTNIVSDTANWTLIYGQYTANGGEKYIIIGDFFPNSLSDTIHYGGGGSPGHAYYYIDDVNVHHCYQAGIAEESEDKNVDVYPNPSEGDFKVSFNRNYKSIRIEITNIIGQMVYKEELKNTNQISLSLKQPPGLYFVSVTTEIGRVNKKIVIE